MRKTQIYLDEEIYKYLKEESLKTGKTISELIREKLRKEINQNKESLLKAIKEVAGIWSYQNEDVESFVRDIRRGERVGNLWYGCADMDFKRKRRDYSKSCEIDKWNKRICLYNTCADYRNLRRCKEKGIRTNRKAIK